jgi:Ni/Fe-hydrogenase subunit HybB-like protein
MTAGFVVGRRLRRLVAFLGGAGLAGVLAGHLTAPERTWPNLLAGGFYLLSTGLGGMLFLSIQQLAGAGWSAGLRRIPEAAMATLPAGAALMLAVFLARRWVYPWSRGDAAGKDGYFDPVFVFARLALILAAWMAIARRMRRASLGQDQGGPPDHGRRLTRLAAVFTVVFGVTFTLASVDWLMSLDPRWASALFALLVAAGVLVQGVAVVTLAAVALRERGPLAEFVTPAHLHDLGKLLFAFSTFWAYLWFSQYLLIWYGNLPEEVGHYWVRTGDAWVALFLLNLALNWAVPFLALLRRDAKRNPRVLKWTAAVVLAGRWLDLYLLVMPEVADAPRLGIPEVLLPAGCVGLGLHLATRALASASLVPVNDPGLWESARHRG